MIGRALNFRVVYAWSTVQTAQTVKELFAFSALPCKQDHPRVQDGGSTIGTAKTQQPAASTRIPLQKTCLWEHAFGRWIVCFGKIPQLLSMEEVPDDTSKLFDPSSCPVKNFRGFERFAAEGAWDFGRSTVATTNHARHCERALLQAMIRSGG